MSEKKWTQAVRRAGHLKVSVAILLWALKVGSATGSDRADAFHCPASFHGNCRCYTDGQWGQTVNCSQADLDNANALEYLPVDTRVLVFAGNHLPDLPLNIFGSVGKYRQLTVIDLSDNGIQTIKGRTFHGVESVRVLILNDNDIYLQGKDSHPRMFSNFDALQELHLRSALTQKLWWSQANMESLRQTFEQSKLDSLRLLDLEKNGIESFPDTNFFCALPSLRELRLADNRLTQFNLNLQCLSYLNALDLARNFISRLDNRTVNGWGPQAGPRLDLSGNPFRCDCHLADWLRWMEENRSRLVSYSAYRCGRGFPPANDGLLLSNLTRNRLLCPYPVGRFDAGLHAVYAVMWLVLVAMVALLLTVVLYKNKRLVCEAARALSLNLRRKFQYHSLDRVEETEMQV